MGGYLDLEGGEPKRSIFLAAKTFETHLRRSTPIREVFSLGLRDLIRLLTSTELF